MTASSLRVVNFSTIVFFLFLSLSLLWGGRNCFRVTARDFQIFLGFFYLGFFVFFLRLCNSFRKKTVNERQPTHSPLSLSLCCSPDLKDLQQGEFDSRTFQVASHVI
jgi:uncharacterized membrane protein